MAAAPIPIRGPRSEPAAGGMEIETKYVVPDVSTFEKLQSLDALGEFRLASPREVQVTDHYLDTPERDLFRGGFVCRRRVLEGGGPEVVTVKGLGRKHGALHRRPEHEVQVPPGSPPDQWPAGPGSDIVRRLSGERPIGELLTVSQRRMMRDVEREGRRVAVLSLDHVDFGAQAGRVDHELEIELTPSGADADLRALADLLQPFGLQPQPLTKFERALELLDAQSGPAPLAEVREPRVRAKGTPAGRRAAPAKAGARPARKGKRMGVLATEPVAEAGRRILRYHRDQMLAHEAGTILGTDPEELHDMRVATRRQRAALRIVGPHYRGKAIRPVREGLRALGGCLGAVRDLDVLLAAARDYQSKLPAAEAGAFKGLLDAWTRRDATARRALLDHLRGKDYADFKERYAIFLDTPGAGARAPATDKAPRPELVADVLRTEVWTHYGRVHAFAPALRAAPVATLHELRIEGKRLRYLLEFFREVLHPCVDEAIKAMVAFQDHLGELQDAVVTIGLIREFLSGPDATTVPGAVSAAGRYLDSRQARIEELRRLIDRPWKGISGSGFKRCLSRAVAAL